jgi:hypothetical protein
MKKECCTIRVSETDKGYCVEIEGENVKSHCKEMMENCCTGDMMKNWPQSCCPPGK